MSTAISKIDKNLQVPTECDIPGCVYRDVRQAPFRIYGLYRPSEGPNFRRLPIEIAEATSENVARLSEHTAGGRIRFRTDSEYVAIRCSMPYISHYSHMPLTGSAGFDMYVSHNGKDVFTKTFVPPYSMTDGYSSVHHFKTRQMREITINFPNYNPVSELYIGLEEDSALGEGRQYTFQKPVVYYGSSITQGGCASRPGNAYAALISQKVDCDYINLGFSGSAKGEDAIMDYIASLDMSIFVYDYDHNAPDPEHLRRTHEQGFQKIRRKHPDLPVIFVSAPMQDHKITSPDGLPVPQFPIRRTIIFNTYQNALQAGDKNVYFVDGGGLFDGDFLNSCTVDGTHPNDLGFFRMASVIGRYVEFAIR